MPVPLQPTLVNIQFIRKVYVFWGVSTSDSNAISACLATRARNTRRRPPISQRPLSRPFVPLDPTFSQAHKQRIAFLKEQKPGTPICKGDMDKIGTIVEKVNSCHQSSTP